MAQKRMIDKKISVSEQVANLSLAGQLIWTWAIPHADDIGLLPHSKRTLKALIVPLIDISAEDFSKEIDSIVKQDLWNEFTYNNQTYYRVNNFGKYQTLKKDRQPSTLLPAVIFKDPKQTWKALEDIGFHLESEEKRREEKEEESGDKSPTNTFESKIQEKHPEYKILIQELAGKDYLSAVQLHNTILDEFLPHWLEKGEKAKKARWQKERSFDYLLRIRTWVKNKHEWQKDSKCRSGKWHRKGETCYCVKEDQKIDYRKLPVSPAARELAKNMRV